MRELQIKAIWVSPYKRSTIDPDFDHNLKNILNRNFSPDTPNTVWVTDIMYVSKAYVKATPASKFIRSYSQNGTPWTMLLLNLFML